MYNAQNKESIDEEHGWIENSLLLLSPQYLSTGTTQSATIGLEQASPPPTYLTEPGYLLWDYGFSINWHYQGPPLTLVGGFDAEALSAWIAQLTMTP